MEKVDGTFFKSTNNATKRKFESKVDFLQPLICNKLKRINEQEFQNQVHVQEKKMMEKEIEKLKNIDEFKDNNFFNNLVKIIKEHDPKKKYSIEVKESACYLFLVSGRLAYENLKANLPLPSISVVLNVLNDEPAVIEGKNYLFIVILFEYILFNINFYFTKLTYNFLFYYLQVKCDSLSSENIWKHPNIQIMSC